MTQKITTPSHEDQLNDVLLAYVEARDANCEPDRAALLAEHPHLRDDLLAFFASHDEVERLTAPFREIGMLNVPQANLLAFSGGVPGTEFRNPSPELGRLGDYQLIREVGRGGMGVVYEADQISLRRRVALKVLPFAAAIDPRQLERFKNEAAAAAHLRHENIVPVYAVGSDRGVHYYAMQFIEGQSLAAVIAELRLPAQQIQSRESQSQESQSQQHPSEAVAAGSRKQGSDTTSLVAMLSTERSSGTGKYFDWVAKVGRQAALALEHAHQTGVVHRDIKPGNLLLDPRGQIWVADFGLAQVSGDSGLTATGELLGTLRYASPEQSLGRRGLVDHRSDVYSLGMTLYELLVLRPPFQSCDRQELLREIADAAPPTLRSINSEIPTSLETIVLKSLRKEPADRYSTAQELADELQRFLERRPILARRPDWTERFWMWARRHPSAIIGCAAALILVSVGSSLSALLIRAEQGRTRAEHQLSELAYQRERQRAEEAESRFALARRAVDELFRVSEEELADRPGMEMLRKRVLLTALAYYQEFLQERRADPDAQAELKDAAHRVEEILAGLAVLKAATHFYLLCQPAILDDLQLTAEQRGKMSELTARVGKQWTESFRDVGQVTPAERGRRTLELARSNKTDLNSILTSPQQIRLRQIGLQSEGFGAFRDPEVALALGLTLEQREEFRILEDNVVFGWMRDMARRKQSNGFASAGEGREKSTSDRILEKLTNVQKRKWLEMIGPPLKGGIVPFGGARSPIRNRP
ncbi:MAG: prkC 27 [Planctomycetaceae bacterium]|nr:prkC 27 [Planctomycetaceae bacterium]